MKEKGKKGKRKKKENAAGHSVFYPPFSMISHSSVRGKREGKKVVDPVLLPL